MGERSRESQEGSRELRRFRDLFREIRLIGHDLRRQVDDRQRRAAFRVVVDGAEEWPAGLLGFPGEGGDRLAGGGVGRGRVIGKTDRIASAPIDQPLRAKDVLATAYHLLGIDPHTEISDRLGRPMPVGSTGRVRPELLA